MPWTGEQFASRHNKKLRGDKASHAARIANRLLKEKLPGGEGEAIAIANKWAKRHRQSGGGVEDLPGITSGPAPKPWGLDRDQARQSEPRSWTYINPRLNSARDTDQGMEFGNPASFPFLSGKQFVPRRGGNLSPLTDESGAIYGRGKSYRHAGQEGEAARGGAMRAKGGALAIARRAVGGNAPQVQPIQTAAPNVNAQGFVPVPQTGTYNLDLTTGAMTPKSNQALQTLAQRGLPITGQPGSTAAQPTAAAPTDWSVAAQLARQPLTGPTPAGDPNDPFGIQAFALQQALAGRGSGAWGGGYGGGAGSTASGSSGNAAVDAANAAAAASGELAAPGAGGIYKHGGRIPKRQSGGMLSMSQATPWWTRREASGEGRAPAGFLRGPTGGRADAIGMGLAPHSHVIPSAVVSHWGQGNGEAGAANLENAFRTGPFGSSLPKPPRSAPRMSMGRAPAMPRYAKGGGIPEHEGGRITMVSHGEYIVPPEDVARIGGGDYDKGHDWLDRLIVDGHRDLAKSARNAPPPVKER